MGQRILLEAFINNLALSSQYEEELKGWTSSDIMAKYYRTCYLLKKSPFTFANSAIKRLF